MNAMFETTSELNRCASQTCQAPYGRFEARIEAGGFAVAVVFVAGLGALGAWAVMLMFQSLVQAQSVIVQNGLVFQR